MWSKMLLLSLNIYILLSIVDGKKIENNNSLKNTHKENTTETGPINFSSSVTMNPKCRGKINNETTITNVTQIINATKTINETVRLQDPSNMRDVNYFISNCIIYLFVHFVSYISVVDPWFIKCNIEY